MLGRPERVLSVAITGKMLPNNRVKKGFINWCTWPRSTLLSPKHEARDRRKCWGRHAQKIKSEMLSRCHSLAGIGVTCDSVTAFAVTAHSSANDFAGSPENAGEPRIRQSGAVSTVGRGRMPRTERAQEKGEKWRHGAQAFQRLELWRPDGAQMAPRWRPDAIPSASDPPAPFPTLAKGAQGG